MTVYLTSAYLAPVSYYVRLLACDKVWVEQHDHYVKQTYRNRCHIASPNGRLALSIPIEKAAPDCEMKDIRISSHYRWQHLHWNALVSSYGQTPFFDYYADDFRPFYEGTRYAFLMDLNEALCRLVCRLIDLDPVMARTDAYLKVPAAGEVDDRQAIHPKKEAADDPFFCPQPYYQVFQQRFGFLPDLSIVDLLFNMGPESLLILQKSLRHAHA